MVVARRHCPRSCCMLCVATTVWPSYWFMCCGCAMCGIVVIVVVVVVVGGGGTISHVIVFF